MGLYIEMQLLKKERDREAQRPSTLKESKETNQATLSAERDATSYFQCAICLGIRPPNHL